MDSGVWTIGIPSNILICGSSGAGKTVFVEKLLQNPHAWEKAVDNITYCYGIRTDTVDRISDKFPEAVLIDNLPKELNSPLEMFSPKQNNLLILDDLSQESQNSKEFTNFLTRGSHHTNTCCISLEHFLYSDAKERRKQSPHFHQIILFRNNRSMNQIALLACQSGMVDADVVKTAYRDVMGRDFAYLIVDTRNDTPDELRLLSNVFGENGDPPYTYI